MTKSPALASPEPAALDGRVAVPDGMSAGDGCHTDIDRLYRQRAGELIRHFTARSRDADAASEVVQEAFARLAALGRSRRLGIARLDAYLYRICQNLLRDRSRTQGLANARVEVARRHLSLAHDPMPQLESRDTLRQLEAAMLRLKPKTREIFLARRLDGMSYAEIAERTGLSVKGVEKQMATAIAKIDRLMHRG